jgi:hypothetical protein
MTPEQIRQIREFDEAETFITDRMPRLWFRIYSRCVEEGFSKFEALEVLKAYIFQHHTKEKG